MIVRGRDFEEIYDLVGVRVLVETVRDCYGALGSLHARWNPVPGRFKDYIAIPKLNMYQSLHTTVIGPQWASRSRSRSAPTRCTDGPSTGVAVLLQVQEDRQARRSRRTCRVRLARRDRSAAPPMLDWQREIADPGADLAALRPRRRRGLRLHPKGAVVSLPAGSTPVDFAYAVHTGGRAPLHRWSSQRSVGALGLGPGERRLGRDPHLEGRRRRPSRDWLAFVKSPRAQQDPPVVHQGTA